MLPDVVDPGLEMAYAEFKRALQENKDMTAPEVLDEFVSKRYKDQVWQRWLDEDIVIGPVPVLRGTKKAVWRDGYTSSTGSKWTALQSFLMTHGGRTADQVLALDKASDEVLFGIGDPTTRMEGTESEPLLPHEGVQKFKGLVIGYVQSGKTANYTALAAKAFDSGYQLVIVLTGIHNALRRQTQIRMNNELGLVPSTLERPTAATSDPTQGSSILQLTSEDITAGDFRNMHISAIDTLPLKPHLCVTKKNASVLQNLISWLGTVKVPTLIIDDEADQASINTAAATDEDELEDDIKPTRINALIRELKNVACQGHTAYVAYTATPYANVFIDMDANHSALEDDLYPSDFIISLPKPPGYMGPMEFFGPEFKGEDGEDGLSERVLRILPKDEVKELQEMHSKPQSGKPLLTDHFALSIKQFLLAVAARRTITGKAVPGSFLAHTSSRVQEQENLGARISQYIDLLHQAWRYNKPSIDGELRQIWEDFQAEMVDGDFKMPFDDLTQQLDNLLSRFGAVKTQVLNFKSQDELDYEENPDLVSIIVGGNKLSRGLTLEGLLFSYFVRKTQAVSQADTLTQMGRFFGYRRDIVDLTRVVTTEKLRSDFREISQMEEALRADVALYQRTGKTPREFAPRVQRRAGVRPTAAIKMNTASIQGRTYSGDLVQSTSFDNSVNAKKINEENLQLTKDFIKQVQEVGKAQLPKGVGETAHRKLWIEVPGAAVLDFISKFQTVDGANRFNAGYLATYIRDLLYFTPKEGALSTGPELTSWSVAIIGRAPSAALGEESFDSDFVFGRLNRSLDEKSDRSIGTLVNPLDLRGSEERGDEIIDLTTEQINEAKRLIKEDNYKSSEASRLVRKKTNGLLLLYPLSPKSTNEKDARVLGDELFGDANYSATITAAALVFPESELEMNEYWRQGRVAEGLAR